MSRRTETPTSKPKTGSPPPPRRRSALVIDSDSEEETTAVKAGRSTKPSKPTEYPRTRSKTPVRRQPLSDDETEVKVTPKKKPLPRRRATSDDESEEETSPKKTPSKPKPKPRSEEESESESDSDDEEDREKILARIRQITRDDKGHGPRAIYRRSREGKKTVYFYKTGDGVVGNEVKVLEKKLRKNDIIFDANVLKNPQQGTRTGSADRSVYYIVDPFDPAEFTTIDDLEEKGYKPFRVHPISGNTMYGDSFELIKSLRPPPTFLNYSVVNPVSADGKGRSPGRKATHYSKYKWFMSTKGKPMRYSNTDEDGNPTERSNPIQWDEKRMAIPDDLVIHERIPIPGKGQRKGRPKGSVKSQKDDTKSTKQTRKTQKAAESSEEESSEEEVTPKRKSGQPAKNPTPSPSRVPKARGVRTTTTSGAGGLKAPFTPPRKKSADSDSE